MVFFIKFNNTRCLKWLRRAATSHGGNEALWVLGDMHGHWYSPSTRTRLLKEDSVLQVHYYEAALEGLEKISYSEKSWNDSTIDTILARMHWKNLRRVARNRVTRLVKRGNGTVSPSLASFVMAASKGDATAIFKAMKGAAVAEAFAA